MYYKSVLKNGLRVISVPKKDSLSVTLLVLVGVGTNFETKVTNGLSHFLEHMCFKGTKKRPRPIDLSSELDSLGADYNAFTGREYTGYYVSCLPDKLDQALDILADMYLNPVFDSLEIEKEKGVIGEEINRAIDNPSRRVQDLFTSLIYGETSRGFNTLGQPSGLAKITRRNFLKFRETFYHAGNTVLVASGKFDQDSIARKLEEHFSAVEQGKDTFQAKWIERQKKAALKIEYRKSEQSNVVLGFRTFGTEDKDYFAAEVLAGALGGTMSSRLWQKIRGEMGAAYSIAAFQSSYIGYGYLAVAGGIQSKQLTEAVRVILAETALLKEELLEPKELSRVKDSIIGTTYLGLETPSDLASYYGIQEVRREELLSPQAWGEEIAKVTAEQVRSLAKKIFVPAALNLAVLGPHKNNKEFEDLLMM